MYFIKYLKIKSNNFIRYIPIFNKNMKVKDITKELCIQWLNNKLINPLTSRKIKENGFTYNLFNI